MSSPKIDPDLTAELKSHADDLKPVAAVFTLDTGPSRSFIPPDEVKATVNKILESVAKESGRAPLQVNVFKNMGAFSVLADAPFMRGLLDRDEIATATANQKSEDLLIRPVASRPVNKPRPGSKRPKR